MTNFRNAIAETAAHKTSPCSEPPYDIADSILSMSEMQFIKDFIRSRIAFQPSGTMPSSEMLYSYGWPESIIEWILAEDE